MTHEQIETLNNVAAYMRAHGNTKAADAIEAAVAALEKLPVTADGVRVVPGMKVYRLLIDIILEQEVVGVKWLDAEGTLPAGWWITTKNEHNDASVFFSTREAAETALAAKT